MALLHRQVLMIAIKPMLSCPRYALEFDKKQAFQVKQDAKRKSTSMPTLCCPHSDVLEINQILAECYSKTGEFVRLCVCVCVCVC